MFANGEGTAHCWGDPRQGQLGPDPGGRYTLWVVRGHAFAAIHAGGSTTCGTTHAGETLCWGGNWVGQLGTRSDEYSDPNPAVIAGGHRFAVLSLGLREDRLAQAACGPATDQPSLNELRPVPRHHGLVLDWGWTSSLPERPKKAKPRGT